MHVPHVFEIFSTDLKTYSVHSIKSIQTKCGKHFQQTNERFMDCVLCHQNHVCMETILWKRQEQQKVILDIVQEKEW